MKTTKTIEVIAGPNGSGKSTFAESYLLKERRMAHFINPDIIAAGLSPLNVEGAAFQAGRVMLTAIKEGINKGTSMAFESTLSGKTWFPILKRAQSAGYEISIYFISLDSVQENIRRIKRRVSEGGHFVPSETVRRRYPKTFSNFWKVYRPICTHWFIFDNSGRRPKLVHSAESFAELATAQQAEFEKRFLKGKHT